MQSKSIDWFLYERDTGRQKFKENAGTYLESY